jgi:hypothetical protein
VYTAADSILKCRNLHDERVAALAQAAAVGNWNTEKRQEQMRSENEWRDKRIAEIRESRGQRAKK